jgi:hypothetical protein
MSSELPPGLEIYELIPGKFVQDKLLDLKQVLLKPEEADSVIKKLVLSVKNECSYIS